MKTNNNSIKMPFAKIHSINDDDDYGFFCSLEELENNFEQKKYPIISIEQKKYPINNKDKYLENNNSPIKVKFIMLNGLFVICSCISGFMLFYNVINN
jgi:hypothetical protein